MASVARDVGSSSTNLSPAVTQLRGTHHIPLCTLRTSVMHILLRVLYVSRIRMMCHRFRPMW